MVVEWGLDFLAPGLGTMARAALHMMQTVVAVVGAATAIARGRGGEVLAATALAWVGTRSLQALKGISGASNVDEVVVRAPRMSRLEKWLYDWWSEGKSMAGDESALIARNIASIFEI